MGSQLSESRQKGDFPDTNLSGIHQVLTIHWDEDHPGFRQKTAIEWSQKAKISLKSQESAFINCAANTITDSDQLGFFDNPVD